ncbi:MAG: PEP-CTERM sorting domain-containing protein [Pirellulaceae bacterium]
MQLKVRFCGFAAGLLILNVMGSAMAGIVIGDTVKASNTFQHPTFSSGIETIFDVATTTVVDPGVEFSNSTAPFVGGLYNIDFGGDSVTLTLNDTSGLSFLNYTAGIFDRYYFGFSGHIVDSVSLAGGATNLTNGLTFGTLAPGFVLDVPDLFSTGKPVPQAYANGGFFLQFGEATDLNNLGDSVTISFSTTAVPEPSSFALLAAAAGVFALRRRRNRTDLTAK